MPESQCIKAKIFLGSETHPSVTQDRFTLEPEKAVQASSRKRQRTSSDLSQREEQSKPGKRACITVEQYEQVPVFADDRIRSLEEENKTLKMENEGLKKKLLKEFACPICGRSYNRSDGLYKHLQGGDKEHRRLAQERYGRRCGTCGKECTRWGDLKKHIAIHKQKVLGSADDLNLESDATMTEDSILKAAWPLDISTSLISEDMVQSPGDPTTRCLPSTPCLKQALGFSNSPARGLGFAPPGYTHPSYNNDILQAPGFSNSPARGLDFAPPSYTHPSLYDNNAVNVQAPGFSNSPARGLNFTPAGYTHPSYDNDTLQTPSFSNSPPRGLDLAFTSYTHLPHNNDALQTPAFSNSLARRLESAPSDNTRPFLYDSVAPEPSSLWPRLSITGQNSIPIG
ncbi:MAG: hypothetical protein Q9217_005087 [Psora testacea]